MNVEEVLKPHQKLAVDMIRKYKRMLIADRMGLGKSLSALVPILADKSNENILIACGKSALSVWPDEIAKWYPEHSHRIVSVVGSRDKRHSIWQRASEGKIYLCGLNSVVEDLEMMPKPWDAAIFDEAHKFRNRKSVMHKHITQVKANNMLLDLTGSPVSRGDHELYTYFEHLWPNRFRSYWKFVGNYFLQDIEFYGNRKILGLNPYKEDEFARLAATLMVRRMSVPGEPDISLFKLPVKMTNSQMEIYVKLAANMIAETTPGELVIASTAMTKTLRLRQLLVCPMLIDEKIGSCGAAIDAILDHFDDHELSHTVIFSPFKSAFPYLKSRIKQYINIEADELVGGMGPDEVKESIQNWRLKKRGVMLCSIQFAQSFDLTHAKVGYFLGFEWEPNSNDQAMFRLQRMSSQIPASVYVVDHGAQFVDGDITEALKHKDMMSHLTNRVIPNIYKLMSQNAY